MNWGTGSCGSGNGRKLGSRSQARKRENMGKTALVCDSEYILASRSLGCSGRDLSPFWELKSIVVFSRDQEQLGRHGVELHGGVRRACREPENLLLFGVSQSRPEPLCVLEEADFWD